MKKTLKEALQEIVDQMKNQGKSINIQYFLFEVYEKTSQWPKTPVPPDLPPEEAEDFADEDQDLENCEILRMPTAEDDSLLFCCGGDWQEPLTIKLELKDGEITVTETNTGFELGISSEEFEQALLN
jgi:hypothetical protein